MSRGRRSGSRKPAQPLADPGHAAWEHFLIELYLDSYKDTRPKDEWDWLTRILQGIDRQRRVALIAFIDAVLARKPSNDELIRLCEEGGHYYIRGERLDVFFAFIRAKAHELNGGETLDLDALLRELKAPRRP